MAKVADCSWKRVHGGGYLANINISKYEAATTRTATPTALATATTLIAHVGDDAFCGLSHQMQFDGAVQKLFFELSTNLATAARQATHCPQVYIRHPQIALSVQSHPSRALPSSRFCLIPWMPYHDWGPSSDASSSDAFAAAGCWCCYCNCCWCCCCCHCDGAAAVCPRTQRNCFSTSAGYALLMRLLDLVFIF